MMTNMTFEQYLTKELSEGGTDLRLRPRREDGVLSFYIEPMNKDGDTLTFAVSGNLLQNVAEPKTIKDIWDAMQKKSND